MTYIHLLLLVPAGLFIIFLLQRYIYSSQTTSSQSSTSTAVVSILVAISAYLIAVFYISHRSSPSDPNEFRLSKIDISKVLKQNLRLAQHSWEHGVLTHALLELQNPELTVFAGPGYGFHLRNPHRVAGGYVVMLDAFPAGKLPRCGGGGSGNMWGMYDEWTRVKGLRYAAGKISTEVRPGGMGKKENRKMWLYREGGETDVCAADAASFGWAALLLERAGAEDPSNPVGAGRNAYGEAADEMVRWLVEDNLKFWLDEDEASGEEVGGNRTVHLPREIGKSEGRRWAISHRNDSPQLWADFVFMVPPFLAAYAVARQEEKWLWEAIEQIKAYHQVLAIKNSEDHRLDEEEEDFTYHRTYHESTSGLWKHIVTQPRDLGEGACCHDEGLWLTGNAWVLAGIARVLAVVERWKPASATAHRPYENQTTYEEKREEAKRVLRNIADDILQSLRPARPWEAPMLRNYVGTHEREYETRAFADAAGTAMVVSATYRLAQVGGLKDWGMLQWTDNLCRLIAEHIDAEGILSPVTSVGEIPAEHSVPETSEGQSFALLMYAARRDCEKIGFCKRVKEASWLDQLLGTG